MATQASYVYLFLSIVYALIKVYRGVETSLIERGGGVEKWLEPFRVLS